MAETTTWTGGCHCGEVRFQVAAKIDGAVSCNCSICSKTGTLLVFVPAAQFQLTAGEDALTDYQFGKKRVHHLFCRRCGVRAFGRGRMPDGSEVVAVNVRCVDGLELAAIPQRSFDGRSLPMD